MKKYVTLGFIPEQNTLNIQFLKISVNAAFKLNTTTDIPLTLRQTLCPRLTDNGSVPSIISNSGL